MVRIEVSPSANEVLAAYRKHTTRYRPVLIGTLVVPHDSSVLLIKPNSRREVGENEPSYFFPRVRSRVGITPLQAFTNLLVAGQVGVRPDTTYTVGGIPTEEPLRSKTLQGEFREHFILSAVFEQRPELTPLSDTATIAGRRWFGVSEAVSMLTEDSEPTPDLDLDAVVAELLAEALPTL